MTTKISCVSVIRDELPFLPRWFDEIRQWADEICIAECLSTDGTHEFLLGQTDIKLVILPPDFRQERGNAESINKAQDLATGSHIVVTSADEMWHPNDLKSIISTIRSGIKNPLLTRTLDYEYDKRFKHDDWPAILGRGKVACTANHVRIYPNTGYRWKGFKHEEPFMGSKNAALGATRTAFRLCHFTKYRTWNEAEKKLRWSYQLIKCYDNPKLREGTSAWWYKVYCPKNESWMRPLHDEYLRRKAAGESI